MRRSIPRLQGLPPGVVVGTLADAIAAGCLGGDAPGPRTPFQTHAFVALNTAALEDGAFISLPRNAVVEEPIHLLFVATATEHPTVSHPRTLILAGENSQATIVETYTGAEGERVFHQRRHGGHLRGECRH